MDVLIYIVHEHRYRQKKARDKEEASKSNQQMLKSICRGITEFLNKFVFSEKPQCRHHLPAQIWVKPKKS